MTPRSCRIVLDEPVIVAQAGADVNGWGPYQFCGLERLTDGTVHLKFHVEADSAKAYGLNMGHAFSNDDGKTWRRVENPSGQTDLYLPGQGVLLPNGDRLVYSSLESPSMKGLRLPRPVGEVAASYCHYTFYRIEEMGEHRLPWRFYRLPRGQSRWIEEHADVEFDGQLLYTVEEVLPAPQMWRMRLMADGSLWGMQYPWKLVNGKVDPKMRVQFLRSTDNGHTWTSHGEIPYQPIASADPLAAKRDGFSEPDATFLPDGSVFALFRTQDGNGNGPSYCSRSTDGGRTWSTPRIFDERGVWPDLLTLKCGVTLAAYGRPGLFVRPTADPTGETWQERVTVVPPAEQMGLDTCAYSALLPLSDHEALIAYSDFKVPGPHGTPRKTIMARRVRVESGHT
ncbi:MAG: glycoside hydrolase [Planctomycetes bacterium]|nr:glycoside hydrolase [Planctomycetota bacterium]